MIDQPTSDRTAPTLTANASRFGWLGAILLVLPVLVYAWVFQRYAVNIPKWDDHALKYFLLQFEQADAIRDKLYEVFKQHNEHRIVIDRVVTWLDYALTGKLNYVHLMAVGSLSLLILLVVFAKALYKAGATFWMALPVSLLIFNLSHWENTFWGMAALQNFTVVALIVAVLYRVAFQPSVDWITIGLAALATITSGNGLLVWPVGLVLLLLKQDFGSTMRWILGTIVTIRLYFLGYEKPDVPPPPKGTLLELVQGWLLFNGAGVEAIPFRNPQQLCLLIGGIITVVTVGLALYKLIQHVRGATLSAWDVFFLGGAAFVLGTGLIVAYNRVGFGLGTLMTSRYKIYSLVWLAFLASYWISQTSPARRWLPALLSVGASFLIAFLSYSTFLNDTIQLRKYLVTSQFNWTYRQNKPVAMLDSVTRRYLDNAPAFYDAHLTRLFHPVAQGPITRLDTLYRSGEAFIVHKAEFPVLGVRDEGAYLLAHSPQRTYLFATQQALSHSLRGWFAPERNFAGGFTAQISETSLDKGRYELYILAISPGNAYRIYPTGQTLEAAGVQYQRPPSNW